MQNGNTATPAAGQPSIVRRTPQFVPVTTEHGSIVTACHATIFDPSPVGKPLKKAVEWAVPGKKRRRGRPRRSEVLANMVLAPRIAESSTKPHARRRKKQQPNASQHHDLLKTDSHQRSEIPAAGSQRFTETSLSKSVVEVNQAGHTGSGSSKTGNNMLSLNSSNNAGRKNEMQTSNVSSIPVVLNDPPVDQVSTAIQKSRVSANVVRRLLENNETNGTVPVPSFRALGSGSNTAQGNVQDQNQPTNKAKSLNGVSNQDAIHGLTSTEIRELQATHVATIPSSTEHTTEAATLLSIKKSSIIYRSSHETSVVKHVEASPPQRPPSPDPDKNLRQLKGDTNTPGPMTSDPNKKLQQPNGGTNTPGPMTSDPNKKLQQPSGGTNTPEPRSNDISSADHGSQFTPKSQSSERGSASAVSSHHSTNRVDETLFDFDSFTDSVRKSQRRKTKTKWYNPVSGSTLVKLGIAGVRDGMVLQATLEIANVDELGEHQKLVGDFDPTLYVDPTFRDNQDCNSDSNSEKEDSGENGKQGDDHVFRVPKGVSIEFKWELVEMPESSLEELKKLKTPVILATKKSKAATPQTTRDIRKEYSLLLRKQLKSESNTHSNAEGEASQSSITYSESSNTEDHDPVVNTANNCNMEAETSGSDSDTVQQQTPSKTMHRVCNPIKLQDFYIALVQQAGKYKEHFYYLSSTAVKHETETHVNTERNRRTGSFVWHVPRWVATGFYTMEIGSDKGRFIAPSQKFEIIDSVGQVDDMDVGVWCICGATQSTVKYSGEWYCCDVCNSWQHAECCRISKPRGRKPNSKKRKVSKTPSLVDEEKRVYNEYNKNDVNFTCWFCTPLDEVSQTIIGSRDLSVKLRTSRVMRTINMITSARMELTSTKRVLHSGGYSRRNDAETKVCITPANVARFLQSLLTEQELNSASRCIDLGCGTGALTRALPKGAYCVEKHPHRYLYGIENDKYHNWIHADALCPGFFESRYDSFDLVVSNPDFEVALQFLFIGLNLLRRRQKSSNTTDINSTDCVKPKFTSTNDGESASTEVCAVEEGEPGSFIDTGTQTIQTENLDDDPNSGPRLIFLLPSDFFEASVLRARLYKLLDFRIVEEYKLGHLSYYADGSQKQTVDSLFVLKPGRVGKYEHKVINARLGGML